MTYTKKMTEGSELKHIILFTLPLFAGNVFQQLYNIVDSIIVGKFLGSDLDVCGFQKARTVII